MRTGGWILIASFAMLASCSGDDASETAPARDAATEGAVQADAGATAASPAPSASPAVPAPGGDLSPYVGKWPFDKVGGHSWNDNPTVRAAIERTVTDPAAREAILTVEGPSSAIAMRNGKVSQWGCQQHNCGDHQWLVEIAPDGSSAEICYFAKAKDAEARWFLPGGKVESRAGDCNLE